jgi:hypothetical protein
MIYWAMGAFTLIYNGCPGTLVKDNLVETSNHMHNLKGYH